MIVDSYGLPARSLAVPRGAVLQSHLIQETSPGPPPGAEPSVFNRLSRLPALRPSTLKLLSISVGSDRAMADFENVFKADPVLPADLFILAHSPAFGVRAPCTISGTPSRCSAWNAS